MFKVGDKFVIELDRKFECNDCSYYKIKGLATTMNEAQLKALDHCDEADKKEEEAYKKGYAKAIEDIQEVVRTLLAMDYNDKDLCFGGSHITAEILSEFDVREIVERLEAYEKEQSKIKVGDEVKVENSGGYLGKAIVTYVDKYEKEIYVVFAGGSAGEITDRTKLRKTGRHFDEIEKLIEILKGGEDSDKVSF